MRKPWLSLMIATSGSVSMYIVIHFSFSLPIELKYGITIATIIPFVTGFPVFYLISYLYRQLRLRYRELNDLNTQKDVLLSLIAHDIRSPLANLQQSLSYAAYDKSHINDAVDTFPYLDQRVRHTLELLDNLLSWSRSQHDQDELPDISPQQLVEALLPQLKEQIEAKGLHIENHINPTLLLPLNHKVLSLVLRNLLINAIKFTPSGGTIRLDCKRTQHHIQLSLQDTGVGMTQETLDKLFTSQQRSSQVGTDGETGTGIGLLLCKQLLHSVRGKIRVHSTLGQGSRFEISLPV